MQNAIQLPTDLLRFIIMLTHQQLSPYEKLRLERIKRNEERLTSLGLFDAKKKQPRFAKSPRRRSQPSGIKIPFSLPSTMSSLSSVSVSVTPSPSRSSRRLMHKPVQYQPMMDDRAKPSKEVKKLAKSSKSSNFIFKMNTTSMDLASSSLSKKEKLIITNKTGDDFLAKFEEYLTNVDALSDQNRRNVIRQITKLANGEGIRYESRAYGWPEGCYFLGGVKVGPTDDILQLMDLGKECEEKWGEDRGNGWLLSHPLKKLYMFQQYLLHE